MKELSYNQKNAVMRVLLDIIYADERIDYRETAYYNKLAEELDLPEEAKENVMKNTTVRRNLAIVKADHHSRFCY